MRFENYLNENVKSFVIKKIQNYTFNKALNFLNKQWNILLNILEKNGVEDKALKIINDKLGLKLNKKDLRKIQKNINLRKILGEEIINESNIINEDFKHYWEMIKSEGFPTLSFYPALTAWIELGKLFDGVDAVNWKKAAVYGLFWLLLVSGKYIKSFFKWKKENPKEYFKERPEKAKKLGIKVEDL